MNKPTQQDLKNQARRDGVHPKVVSLLRRAVGLDLLDGSQQVTEVLDAVAWRSPLSPGQRVVDYTVNDKGTVDQTVCTIEQVNYPIAGYPEAYPA